MQTTTQTTQGTRVDRTHTDKIEQILIIDITTAGLLLERSVKQEEFSDTITSHLPLPLPFRDGIDVFKRETRPKLKTRTLLKEEAVEELRLALAPACNRTAIVFGSVSDPFYPFEEKFDIALALLALIAELQPANVVIQTRSPLIVLSLPMLKALENRVTVTMAIEAANDLINCETTPHLPRASERIKATRALKRFNIHTVVQAAPIVWDIEHAHHLRTMAAELAEISSEVHIFPFEQLIPPRNRKNFQHTVLTKGRIYSNAHLGLRDELLKLLPKENSSFHRLEPKCSSGPIAA